ncbi:unnamed protein product [Adineta steineri]|uniref:Homeobox domain-containing protein n=1 Tax=Adineta steineri TaxID=433720 RepID=A0A813MAY6_9BILA|nr:unnamed protein product [Adineta steineri]CAF3806438.1 unnamed protein product [Adineta steineri]
MDIMALAMPHHGQIQAMNKSNRRHQRIEREFTSDQIAELENEFSRYKYLTNRECFKLAHRSGLNEQQVTIWFSSRRKKWLIDNTIGYLYANPMNPNRYYPADAA